MRISETKLVTRIYEGKKQVNCGQEQIMKVHGKLFKCIKERKKYVGVYMGSREEDVVSCKKRTTSE